MEKLYHATKCFSYFYIQDDKEQKRLAELQRKREARALLEQEESKLQGKSKTASAAPKVTRAQIEVQKQREAQIQKEAQEQMQKEKETSSDFAGENPNLAMAAHLAQEGVTEARNVEDAISVLSIKGDDTELDKHPEKRMKAAYTAFEGENLPRLKAENPNLRLSQLKQMLRKEWMKSPSNPMNQGR